MDENVNPVENAAETNQPVKGDTKPAGSPEGDYTSDTKVSTMADLKEVAPKVAESMNQGIAMNIIRRMRRSQDRLKKLMREMRR